MTPIGQLRGTRPADQSRSRRKERTEIRVIVFLGTLTIVALWSVAWLAADWIMPRVNHQIAAEFTSHGR